eukprot:Amastigsp_a10941_40.p1 type:complete len:330 gc:universal Amastigsp_a10941_40:45-1034(+)
MADPRSFLTPDVKAQLRTVEFNMLEYEIEQLVYLWEFMFHDLGFVDAFSIEPDILLAFLVALTRNYNEVPFHNVWHAFSVSQMMYTLFCSLESVSPFLTTLEKFSTFVAGLCHDLDHQGLNNAYQVNAQTPLAMVYNDVSCLENHHCSHGFAILSSPESNIFLYLPPSSYREVRRIMVKCILATDMANHFRIKDEFSKVVAAGFSMADAAHRALLCTIILMCCDISNEVRPTPVAREWAERLALEFSLQVELERSAGLPVAPFMDPVQTPLAKSQIGFISGVLLPLWREAHGLLPQIADYVRRIEAALEYWKAEEASSHGGSGSERMSH